MPEKREIEKSEKKCKPVIKKKKIITPSSDEDYFEIAFADSSNDDATFDEATEYKRGDEDMDYGRYIRRKFCFS